MCSLLLRRRSPGVYTKAGARRRKTMTELEEFLADIVELANNNESRIDGTTKQVRRFLAENDIVFGVWQDPSKEYEADCHRRDHHTERVRTTPAILQNR